MRRVRMGIAGLGRLGQFHAENMAGRAPSIELVRVVDPIQDVARSTGERLGVRWSTVFDDLLNDPAIEAVVIASPTAYHAPMIEQAAAAGKQIFCEKPISLEREPTERAIAAARAAGVTAIGVTWGGIHDLDDADVLVSSPEELLAAL